MIINIPYLSERTVGVELTEYTAKICLIKRCWKHCKVEAYAEFNHEEIGNTAYREFIVKNKLKNYPAIVTLPLKFTSFLSINLEESDENPEKDTIEYYLGSNGYDITLILYNLSNYNYKDKKTILISIISRDDFTALNDIIIKTELPVIQITDSVSIFLEHVSKNSFFEYLYIQDSFRFNLTYINDCPEFLTEKIVPDSYTSNETIDKSLAFQAACLFSRYPQYRGFLPLPESERKAVKLTIKNILHLGKISLFFILVFFLIFTFFEYYLNNKMATLQEETAYSITALKKINLQKSHLKKQQESFADLTKIRDNKDYVSGLFDLLLQELPKGISFSRLRITNNNLKGDPNIPRKSVYIYGTGQPKDVYSYIAFLEKQSNIAKVTLVKMSSQDTAGSSFSLEIVYE
ncbi:MAG: hypothetical protein PHR06_05180 [Candidatus Cloacimonetes bacterium]|nr:hypothetical protein [Candidatus Cloacimonadota bacterium]